MYGFFRLHSGCMSMGSLFFIAFHPHSQQQQAAIFSKKALINPLYTTCPAPKSRQTQLWPVYKEMFQRHFSVISPMHVWWNRCTPILIYPAVYTGEVIAHVLIALYVCKCNPKCIFMLSLFCPISCASLQWFCIGLWRLPICSDPQLSTVPECILYRHKWSTKAAALLAIPSM